MGSINLFYWNCIPGTYQIVQPMFFFFFSAYGWCSICIAECMNKSMDERSVRTNPTETFYSFSSLWSPSEMGRMNRLSNELQKYLLPILKNIVFFFSINESCSVLSDSLWSHGLCPWNSPGQNTGVGSLFLLQGIFPTQGLNPGPRHCKQIIYQLNHQGTQEYWRR